MTTPDDEDFLRRAGASLDAGVDHLDAATRARLAGIRARALERPRRRPFGLRLGIAVPAAALAFGVLFAVGITLWSGGGPVPAEPLALADDDADLLEVLASADPADLVDDPDFYVWVEEELSSGADRDAG